MSDAPRFKLYGDAFWISPYFFSSFVALTEKGVPFDIVEVALFDGAHLEPTYRDASLTARIPSLDHDGFTLAESSAIAEYLEEVLVPPAHWRLLPADAKSRARARQVMAWLRSDLGALRYERATVRISKDNLYGIFNAEIVCGQRLNRVRYRGRVSACSIRQ